MIEAASKFRFSNRSVAAWLLFAFCAAVLGGCASTWIGPGFPGAGDAALESGAITGRVRIDYDPSYVPHIHADNDADAFFGLGYAMASARLHSMDVLRHTARGRLAELYGPSARVLDEGQQVSIDYVETDYFLRLMDFTDTGKRYLRAAPVNDRALFGAFARGVNAFAVLQGKRLSAPYSLPAKIGGRTFEPWTAEDSAAVMALDAWLSSPGYADEYFAVLALQAGLPTPRIMDMLSPYYALKTDQYKYLDDMRDRLQGMRFVEGIAMFDLFCRTELRRTPNSGAGGAVAIAGGRSHSGSPLIAVDAQGSLGAPGDGFVAHLKSPGFNAAGAFPTGVPLMPIGHNAAVAWGATPSRADTADLAIETIDDQGVCRVAGIPQPMRTRRISFGTGAHKTARDLYATDFGPVITRVEPGVKAAVSLRWSGWEGGDFIGAAYRLMRAKSVYEVREAAPNMGLWSANLIYADVGGGIGWSIVGDIPQRRGFSGFLPKDGADPAQFWSGLLPIDQRPGELNPKSGFIALTDGSPDDPRADAVSSAYSAPYRRMRLKGLLGKADSQDIDGLRRAFRDSYSEQAEAILPYVMSIARGGQEAQEAIRILREWDKRAASDSLGALYYEVFLHHFTLRVLDGLEPNVRAAYLARPPYSQMPFDALVRKESAFWKNLDERDEIITASLTDASRELGVHFKDKLTTAVWGDLHKARFTTSLAGTPFIGGNYVIAPLPFGGDGNTLGGGPFNYGVSYDVSSCPAFRFLADLREIEKSRFIASLGQSEIPTHPSHLNFLQAWYNGDDLPLLFTDADMPAWVLPSTINFQPSAVGGSQE